MKSDIIKRNMCSLSLIFSVILTGLMLFLFSLVVNNPLLSRALGAENPSFHLGLDCFWNSLQSAFSDYRTCFQIIISRRNEFEADRFVKENYKPEILADALKKLSVKNLSNMMPHPAYVFFHYSHPPLLQQAGKIGMNFLYLQQIFASLAQLVEQLIRNEQVVGSSPIGGSSDCGWEIADCGIGDFGFIINFATVRKIRNHKSEIRNNKNAGVAQW